MSAHTTHGLTASPTYRSWQHMKRRCCEVTHHNYYRYGARGIKVCDRWLESFENFLADMGIRPEGTTLDRKDGTKDYTPDNCRWATPTEQTDNRILHYEKMPLTFNGVTKPINVWAQELNVKTDTLRRRLNRGWTVEKALTR
jgi:hypothetical protein